MLTRLKAAGPVAYLFIGVASAAAGLLPWLLTGMRLPLQNLWAVDTDSADMPRALLPFSQYMLPLIVAVLVTGSAIAGAFARAARPQPRRFTLFAAVAAAVAVQAVAAVQTAVTVSNGLAGGLSAGIYLSGLVAGTATAVLLGLLVLLLIARAPAPGAAVALSIAAVALAPWLTGMVLAFSDGAAGPNMALLALLRWVPALAVGLALAWSGFGTFGRAAAAAGGLLILWLGPAMFAAVSAAAGSRVYAYHPAEMADLAGRVFVGTLWGPGGSLPLVSAAAAVMVLGLAGRRVVRRRHPAVIAA